MKKLKLKLVYFQVFLYKYLKLKQKKVLVYNSKLSAARAIGVSNSTIRRYIILKKNLFNKYLIIQLNPLITPK